MNLLKYLTLTTALVNCAHAIVLEDIIAGKYLKSAKGEEEKVPCQEAANSIPAFCTAVEPMLMDVEEEEEGSVTFINAGSGSSLIDEENEGEGAASRIDGDSLRNTADEEEGTDIQQDDGWASEAFEKAKINEAIAEFFAYKRVAYYLGSFDPVHLGHEAVANHVINMEVITQIINDRGVRDKINYNLMCPIWGGDTMKQRTDIKLRLDMLFEAFKDDPNIIVTRLSPYELQTLFTQQVSPNHSDIVVKIPGLKFFGLIGSDIPPTFYEKMQQYVPNFMKGTVITPDRMFNTFGAVDALPVERYFIALRKGAPQEIKEMKEFVGKSVTVFKPRSKVNRISSTEFKKQYREELMSTTALTAEEKVPLRDEKDITLTAETMVHPAVFRFILNNNLYNTSREISCESLTAQAQQDGSANGEEGKVEIMDYIGKVLSIPTVEIESVMEEKSDDGSTEDRDLDDNDISIYHASTSVPTYLPPVKDELSSKKLVRNLHLSPRGGDPESPNLKFDVIGNNNLSPRFGEVTSGSETPFKRVVKHVKERGIALRRMLSKSRSAGNQSTSGDNKKNERPLGKSQSTGSSVNTASKRLRTLSRSQPEQERTTFILTGDDNYTPLVKSQSLGSPLGNPNTATLAKPNRTPSLELNLDALSAPRERQRRSLSMSDPSYFHKGKVTPRKE